MWRDIFGEGERCRNDIFVQQVDVVAFRVGWIVIEGEIAGEHGILFAISKVRRTKMTKSSAGKEGSIKNCSSYGCHTRPQF